MTDFEPHKGKTMSEVLQLGPLHITFHRTLRVPRGRGLSNALPPSLGHFPIVRIKDCEGAVPTDWNPEGHVIPLWPQEAMWMGFSRSPQPVVLLVGAGMVNAITGERLKGKLVGGGKQNYLVTPPQPWLDGFKPNIDDHVFQFVAAELGKGETAEEQILGTAEFGGVQFGMYTPKARIAAIRRPRHHALASYDDTFESMPHDSLLSCSEPKMKSFTARRFADSGMIRRRAFAARSEPIAASVGPRAVGLGRGGAIEQKIYPDPYLEGREPEEVWGSEPDEKAYVYIVHAADWPALTGKGAAPSPITEATYRKHNLPWFLMEDGSWGDVEGSSAIANLKPVSGGVDLTPKTKSSKTKNVW